jgi:type II secretory pathway predicted ATPase ExeA
MAAYKQFFGLTRGPFGKALEPRLLLRYSQLDEFVEEMDAVLEDGGIAVLDGEMGIGKTTALRHLRATIDERSFQVCYTGGNRHAVALLQGVVDELGVVPARIRSSLLRQVKQRVERAFHEERKKTFLIVDEAHLLQDDLLEDLRLLTNFGMDADEPLILLLVGHPALRKKLQQPVHLALWDRVRMHYRLEGLSREETSAYIDHHMRAAGGAPEVFTADAQEAVFEAAQGIPRRINLLCLGLLKKAATRKISSVDGKFITAVRPLLKAG